MKIYMKISLILACGFFCAGCSIISSSCHAVKGMEYFENDDLTNAIVEFEEAERFCPIDARNHTYLSAAYFRCGDFEKGWYHIRRAVLCRIDDGVSMGEFVKVCQKIISEPGLDKPGTSWDEIECQLGTPDNILRDKNNKVIACGYGTCEMFFLEEKLTKCFINTTWRD
jgi:hypothetical protein